MLSDREALLGFHCVGALLALGWFLRELPPKSDLIFMLALLLAAIWPISVPALLVSRSMGRR